MSVLPGDLDEVEKLKLTVLKPFYDRINEDAATIVRLQEMVQVAPVNQSLNRKRSPSPCESTQDDGPKDGNLLLLVTEILEELRNAAAQETIQLCGLGVLHLIVSRPEDVFSIAETKLSTWPYSKVPPCWRRLYEEASLYIAVDLLQAQAMNPKAPRSGPKRSKTLPESEDSAPQDWLAQVIKVLDCAIVISGAPGRRELIETILLKLDPYSTDEQSPLPQRWRFGEWAPLVTDRPISRTAKPLSFEAFQSHLKFNPVSKPLIIPGALENWPAKSKWQDLTYLMRMTHGGRRLVPVEIGTTYTDENWSQQIMTFASFADRFLVPEEPEEIGYLAQHDLFAQIPGLKADVVTPDYCFTTPPEPTGAAAKTPGLSTARMMDEPLMNAWLGPKGTRTPLHTDPYENLFCQVVGYKYVRLYPPEEAENLYPLSTDAAGISMDNTSQVDVHHIRPDVGQDPKDLAAARSLYVEFPRLKDAEYTEAILAPGDCLYVPLGYWHYVESLTASFSVSFWWN